MTGAPFGSNVSRAVHSNHMAGHVWEAYASETYRKSPATDPKIPSDGGRGYYRNISLLSLWAYAPFLHNNSVGPELCGGGKNADEFYASPYVDSIHDPLRPTLTKPEPDCWRFDTPHSVTAEGRYELYKKSMADLLNPSRTMKVTMLTHDAEAIGPMGIRLTFPKGKPAALIINFRHKEFARDLRDVLNAKDRRAARAILAERRRAENVEQILNVFEEIKRDPKSLVTIAHKLSPIYTTSADLIENAREEKVDPGRHPIFNQQFSDEDKKALTAFLATL